MYRWNELAQTINLDQKQINRDETLKIRFVEPLFLTNSSTKRAQIDQNNLLQKKIIYCPSCSQKATNIDFIDGVEIGKDSKSPK